MSSGFNQQTHTLTFKHTPTIISIAHKFESQFRALGTPQLFTFQYSLRRLRAHAFSHTHRPLTPTKPPPLTVIISISPESFVSPSEQRKKKQCKHSILETHSLSLWQTTNTQSPEITPADAAKGVEDTHTHTIRPLWRPPPLSGARALASAMIYDSRRACYFFGCECESRN